MTWAKKFPAKKQIPVITGREIICLFSAEKLSCLANKLRKSQAGGVNYLKKKHFLLLILPLETSVIVLMSFCCKNLARMLRPIRGVVSCAILTSSNWQINAAKTSQSMIYFTGPCSLSSICLLQWWENCANKNCEK